MVKYNISEGFMHEILEIKELVKVSCSNQYLFYSIPPLVLMLMRAELPLSYKSKIKQRKCVTLSEFEMASEF